MLENSNIFFGEKNMYNAIIHVFKHKIYSYYEGKNQTLKEIHISGYKKRFELLQNINIYPTNMNATLALDEME